MKKRTFRNRCCCILKKRGGKRFVHCCHKFLLSRTLNYSKYAFVCLILPIPCSLLIQIKDPESYFYSRTTFFLSLPIRSSDTGLHSSFIAFLQWKKIFFLNLYEIDYTVLYINFFKQKNNNNTCKKSMSWQVIKVKIIVFSYRMFNIFVDLSSVIFI